MQHATSRTHESSSKTSVPENSTQISDNVTYQNRSNSNALQPSCRAQSEVLLEHDIDEVPKTKKTGKPQHPQQMPNSLNWAEAIVSLDSRTRRNPSMARNTFWQNNIYIIYSNSHLNPNKQHNNNNKKKINSAEPIFHRFFAGNHPPKK